MRHFVSVNQETEYRDTLANRVGVLGDLQVQTSGLLSPYGVPMKSVQLMPETLGLFTNPLNLIFGIQRQISLEFDQEHQRARLRSSSSPPAWPCRSRRPTPS